MIYAMTQKTRGRWVYLLLSFTCMHARTHAHAPTHTKSTVQQCIAPIRTSTTPMQSITAHFLHLTYRPASNTSSGSRTAVIFGRQCHCHTSNRNLVLVFRPLPLQPPHPPPPPVKQRKFSQRAINIKWNPVSLVRFPFLPFPSSPLHSDSGTSAVDKPGKA